MPKLTSFMCIFKCSYRTKLHSRIFYRICQSYTFEIFHIVRVFVTPQLQNRFGGNLENLIDRFRIMVPAGIIKTLNSRGRCCGHKLVSVQKMNKKRIFGICNGVRPTLMCASLYFIFTSSIYLYDFL